MLPAANRALRQPLLLALLLCLIGCVGSCSEQPAEAPPTPPDLTAILQSYEAPSAPLTPETAGEAMAQAQDALDLLLGMEGLDLLIERVLGAALADDETEAQALGARALDVQQRGLTLQGAGFLRVRRICDGWGPQPTPDADANGTIDLTAVFTEEGVDPVVWGGCVACRYVVDGLPALMDGGVQLHLGTRIGPGRALGSEPILLAFAGALGYDDREWSGELDLRALTSGVLELRTVTSQGDLIYTWSKGHIGFRASDGAWTCDLEAKQCSHDELGTIVSW